MNDIALIQPETALTVFTSTKGADPYLAQVRAEIDSFTPDIKTKKGREAIASLAYKVAKIKSYLDGVGKDLADTQKEIPKKIDAERKRIRDTLDTWKDEVRQPLTEWEQEEETRKARIEMCLSELQACAESTHLDQSALLIRERLVEVQSEPITEELYGEYLDGAQRLTIKAIATLEAALIAAEKREAEARELDALRAEKAARDKADAEAKAKREAEERAAQIERDKERAAKEAVDAEKQAAEKREKAATEEAVRREQDLKKQAEDAERRTKEANERALKAEREAKAKAERELAEKAQQEAEAQAKREKDKANRAKVHRIAKEHLVAGGLTEEQATLAVTLIAKKAIPAITMAY